MAIESIAKTLGSGSGIDITALVTQLVDAQYAAKNDAFTNRDTARLPTEPCNAIAVRALNPGGRPAPA